MYRFSMYIDSRHIITGRNNPLQDCPTGRRLSDQGYSTSTRSDPLLEASSSVLGDLGIVILSCDFFCNHTLLLFIWSVSHFWALPNLVLRSKKLRYPYEGTVCLFPIYIPIDVGWSCITVRCVPFATKVRIEEFHAYTPYCTIPSSNREHHSVFFNSWIYWMLILSWFPLTFPHNQKEEEEKRRQPFFLFHLSFSFCYPPWAPTIITAPSTTASKSKLWDP